MLGFMLTHKLAGELYRVSITEKGFTLTISRLFYDHLLDSIKEKTMREEFLGIPGSVQDNIVTFELDLPLIPYPNHSHKRMDWEALWMRSAQMSFLFGLCNYGGTEDDRTRFCLSTKPQLVAIGMQTIRGNHSHSCPIELGLHPSAFAILTEECKKGVKLPEVEAAMLKLYSRLSCSTVKERRAQEALYRRYSGSFIGIRAIVRAEGVPDFIVPGNCACLGVNPDEFKDSLSMYSHNMDAPHQQLSMLAGIVTFWNNFLTPKLQAEREKIEA